MQYRKVRDAIYIAFALENRVYDNCCFQFDVVYFREIEAHWKSVILEQFTLDQFLFVFLFFQITVLNNLLNYFDFLN